jgi:hypothetical protein
MIDFDLPVTMVCDDNKRSKKGVKIRSILISKLCISNELLLLRSICYVPEWCHIYKPNAHFTVPKRSVSSGSSNKYTRL